MTVLFSFFFFFTHVRRVRDGGVLRSVNTDRNFAGGGTQFLIQSAVRSDPHVVLRDSHLQLSGRRG